MDPPASSSIESSDRIDRSGSCRPRRPPAFATFISSNNKRRNAYYLHFVHGRPNLVIQTLKNLTHGTPVAWLAATCSGLTTPQGRRCVPSTSQFVYVQQQQHDYTAVWFWTIFGQQLVGRLISENGRCATWNVRSPSWCVPKSKWFGFGHAAL